MTTAQKARIARNRKRLNASCTAGRTTGTQTYVAPARQSHALRVLDDIADSKSQRDSMRPVRKK